MSLNFYYIYSEFSLVFLHYLHFLTIAYMYQWVSIFILIYFLFVWADCTVLWWIYVYSSQKGNSIQWCNFIFIIIFSNYVEIILLSGCKLSQKYEIMQYNAIRKVISEEMLNKCGTILFSWWIMLRKIKL